MLEETVKELQGEKPPVKIAAVVDLDVDAFITRSYIPDEGQRMDMYRRVAGIATLADYQDVLDEWLDRYGEPPAAALTLADIAYIRSAAERNGINRICQQQNNLVLTYAEGFTPDMAILSRLLVMPAYKGLLLFNAGTKTLSGLPQRSAGTLDDGRATAPAFHGGRTGSRCCGAVRRFNRITECPKWGYGGSRLIVQRRPALPARCFCSLMKSSVLPTSIKPARLLLR